MRTPHAQLHDCFLSPPAVADPAFVDLLATRRRQLALLVEELTSQLHEREPADRNMAAWFGRTYPVLAVLAPVMATHQGKIEYPGDPMCLYSALTVAIDQVVQARATGLEPESSSAVSGGYVYNDLCPQWGILPSREYRFQVSDSGIREYTDTYLNTDQTIFDPRVWNEEVKRYFVDHLLLVLQPRVVLISTVSPGHRYALDIARLVRRHLPDTLIILGGRHIDETIHFHDEQQQISLAYSSPLRAMADGRIPPVIDFTISGEGYFALDLLMKAISAAMDLQQRKAAVPDVVQTLEKLAPLMGPLPGRAVLVAVEQSLLHVFPLRGPRFDLASLPSPYRAAAIRARFPIFQSDGTVLRTAHSMVSNACPYHCNFCSEGVTVVGRMLRFAADPVQPALERVFEYISYGAEALFFDDSVFWAGNTKLMLEFAQALAQAKAAARAETFEGCSWFKDAADVRRLADLQWGAQLTAEFLTTLHPHDKILECLQMMRLAGCTYLYMGIESMASAVMDKVHKNLSKGDGPSWSQKIRAALLLLQEAGIRAGSSVLFGLDGETRETIEETIEGVGKLIDEGLLWLASPNILTYHPATAITALHGKKDQLDYHSLDVPNKPPYIYFEEAFPGVVSKELSEDDIWYIHRQTKDRWGQVRYTDLMRPASIPLVEARGVH